MKHKKLLYIIIPALMLSFLGCEKEYLDETRITYFPDIVVEGGIEYYHLLGTPYIDPTVTATEDGETLEVKKTQVVGEMTGYKGTSVNADVADKYSISYSATNSDGYDGSVTRNIFVGKKGDLITNIEGIYISDVQRAPTFKSEPAYTGMKCIFITKTGDNTYEISDAIGGYYYMGRAYGYDYAAQGAVITVNDIASNNYSFTQADIPGFGNVVDISDFKVDAVSKTITFTGTGDFGNGVFHVQLTQVDF